MLEEFVVGVIRGPHGTSGMCKVESTSGICGHIASMKEVALRNGEQRKSLAVEQARVSGGIVLMKFSGLDSPEAVRSYSGFELVIPRNEARQLQDGEWFIEDLKGCSLVYEGHESKDAPTKKVGTITDVLEGGAASLFEVLISEDCTFLAHDAKYTAQGKLRMVYVPFVTEHIGKIDIAAKTVQLMHLWILE